MSRGPGKVPKRRSTRRPPAGLGRGARAHAAGRGRGLRAKLSAQRGADAAAGCWRAVVSAGCSCSRSSCALACGLRGRRKGQKRRAARDGCRALTIIVAFAQQRQLPPRRGRDAAGPWPSRSLRPPRFRRRSDAPGDVGTLVGVERDEAHGGRGSTSVGRRRSRSSLCPCCSFFCGRRAGRSRPASCLVAVLPVAKCQGRWMMR